LAGGKDAPPLSLQSFGHSETWAQVPTSILFVMFFVFSIEYCFTEFLQKTASIQLEKCIVFQEDLLRPA